MFSWCEGGMSVKFDILVSSSSEQRDEGYRSNRQLHKLASVVNIPLYQLYINVHVTEHW